MVILHSLQSPLPQFPFRAASQWFLPESHVPESRQGSFLWHKANPSLAWSWTPGGDWKLGILPTWIKHWVLFLEAWLSSDRLSTLFQLISLLALLSPGLSSALQNSEGNVINDFDGICYLLAKHIPLGPRGSFQRQSPIDKLPWPNFQKTHSDYLIEPLTLKRRYCLFSET